MWIFGLFGGVTTLPYVCAGIAIYRDNMMVLRAPIKTVIVIHRAVSQNKENIISYCYSGRSNREETTPVLTINSTSRQSRMENRTVLYLSTPVQVSSILLYFFYDNTLVSLNPPRLDFFFYNCATSQQYLRRRWLRED